MGDAAIINFSTGTVGVPVAKRIAYLEAGRPAVAALNMGSMNYAKYSRSRKDFVFKFVFANPFEEIIELLEAMRRLGIKPEHECFDVGHVASLEPLLDMGLLEPPLHADFVMGVVGGIPASARNLAAMADNLQAVGGRRREPVRHHWGVIGIGRAQWMLVAAALTLGGSIRVGLEDNFYLPDGRMARSNGELIAKARQMTEDAGRRPATVEEARALLGIKAGGAGMSALPLEGLTVLDLTRLLPGGFCSLLLADFGADVIKVEDTGMGDYVRWTSPGYEGAEHTARSAAFLALNRGKRSIRINLKSDGGRDVLLRLARDADVLLESFRPGVLDRLGVGYERLRQENPGLVYCAITGYGQDGPARERSGHDMNYLGLNGLLGLTGETGGPPMQSAGQIADLGGGALMAAVGILVALRERERSGQGQLVDCSMFDGSLSWLAMVAADLFAGGAGPAARSAAAGRRHRLLPPVPVRRRVGHAGCARAEVLGRVLPWGGTRGPAGARVRPAGIGCSHRRVRGVRGAHPGAVAAVRLRARLLPRAGARARRGAELRARGCAGDGRRAVPARRGGTGAVCSVRRSS